MESLSGQILAVLRNNTVIPACLALFSGGEVKRILSIAGSDCSGGAGIQADLKTFSALGTYGMSVICAITAQNTLGVDAVFQVPPEMVTAQLRSVFEDCPPDAVKIGMLGSPEIIAVVAEALRRYRPSIIVLDPVMVSKSGARLLQPDAEAALIQQLIPLSTLITPNLPEASVLLAREVASTAAMKEAAVALRALGAQAALLKGGHLSESSDDLLIDEEGVFELPSIRIKANHTHGTGCSLSSAIAAFLGRGRSLREAVKEAKHWVAAGIAQGLAVGHGIGPIHHFHQFYTSEGAFYERIKR